MKVNCPISGVTYIILSPAIGHSIATHPMLSGNVSTANLTAWFMEPWATGKLDDTTVHLLGLALVQKLPIESIAFPPLQERELEACAKIWHGTMERLFKLAYKLERRDRKFKFLSQFRLGMDTMTNLTSWIGDLQTQVSLSSEPISEKAKELNRASYKTIVETSAATVASLLEPEQVDNMILRALNSSPLTTSEGRALPVVLSDWARKVTDFPSNVSTRWQKIIQVIFQPDYINQILMDSISVAQIKALEEHLVLNTPMEAVGTSHSRLLMDRISKVIPVIEDFSPEIGGRRKSTVGNAGVLDALLGSDDKTGQDKPDTNQCPSQPAAVSTSTKPMTLTERLAARMACIKGGQ